MTSFTSIGPPSDEVVMGGPCGKEANIDMGLESINLARFRMAGLINRE